MLYQNSLLSRCSTILPQTINTPLCIGPILNNLLQYTVWTLSMSWSLCSHILGSLTTDSIRFCFLVHWGKEIWPLILSQRSLQLFFHLSVFRTDAQHYYSQHDGSSTGKDDGNDICSFNHCFKARGKLIFLSCCTRQKIQFSWANDFRSSIG